MDSEEEINRLQRRNRSVEVDKAWEISIFRVLLITLITYGIALVFLLIIEQEDAHLVGLVPAGGYLLSVQTFPFIKRWWIKNVYNKRK